MSRKGPPEPRLAQVGRNPIQVDNNEVYNSSSGFACVRANVAVSAGKYYFEVRLVSSGNMRIGWATEAWKGNDTLGGDNEGYGFDGSQPYKYHGGNSELFTDDTWRQGDTMGSMIDLEKGQISYYRNGELLGVAFNNVAKGVYYSPAASLYRRQRLLFNFGKEQFCLFSGSGFLPLVQLVSDADMRKFEQTFLKYSKMSNDGAEALEPPVIRGDALLQLGKDVGVKDDTDPMLLFMLWKLGSKQQFIVTMTEFVQGFASLGVGSLEGINNKISEWRKLLAEPRTYEEFYNWMFEYLRGEAKSIAPETALTAWQILDLEARWPLYGKWVSFFKDSVKKNMSRDNWQQTLRFSRAFPKEVKGYDDTDDFPTLMDEFVQWLSRH